MYPIIACDAVWSLMSSSLTAFRERGRVTATGRCGGWPTGAGRGREAGWRLVVPTVRADVPETIAVMTTELVTSRRYKNYWSFDG